MNEAFTKALYESIIEDGSAAYADIFEHTVPDRRTTPHWPFIVPWMKTRRPCSTASSGR